MGGKSRFPLHRRPLSHRSFGSEQSSVDRLGKVIGQVATGPLGSSTKWGKWRPQMPMAFRIPERIRNATAVAERSPTPRFLLVLDRIGNGPQVKSQPVGMKTKGTPEGAAKIGPSSVTRATSKSLSLLATADEAGRKIELLDNQSPISTKSASARTGSEKSDRGIVASSRNSRTSLSGFSLSPTASSNMYGPNKAIRNWPSLLCARAQPTVIVGRPQSLNPFGDRR